MLSGRLAIILLTLFSLVFWTAPSSFAQQRQRRVFTNDDLPVAAAPAPTPAPAPAPPAPAATPAAPAEGTPGEAAPGAEAAPSASEGAAEADPNLPPGLSLSNFLQGTLRRFHTEFADRLEQETDPARQERLKLMMQLTMQLLAQNQLYIADIQAQQQQAEAQASSQAGAQPPPAP